MAWQGGRKCKTRSAELKPPGVGRPNFLLDNVFGFRELLVGKEFYLKKIIRRKRTRKRGTRKSLFSEDFRIQGKERNSVPEKNALTTGKNSYGGGPTQKPHATHVGVEGDKLQERGKLILPKLLKCAEAKDGPALIRIRRVVPRRVPGTRR